MINYTKQSDALYQEIKRNELMLKATEIACEKLLKASSHYPRKHYNTGTFG